MKFDRLVDIGITGDDISELGLQRRLRHVRIRYLFLRAGMRQRQREHGENDRDGRRGPRRARYEPLNAADAVLNMVVPERRSTLVARIENAQRPEVLRFDILLQGEHETVFFDV